MRKLILLSFILLTSCSGFSKGITEAILQHEAEDTRKCLIVSQEIKGIASFL